MLQGGLPGRWLKHAPHSEQLCGHSIHKTAPLKIHFRIFNVTFTKICKQNISPIHNLNQFNVKKLNNSSLFHIVLFYLINTTSHLWGFLFLRNSESLHKSLFISRHPRPQKVNRVIVAGRKRGLGGNVHPHGEMKVDPFSSSLSFSSNHSHRTPRATSLHKSKPGDPATPPPPLKLTSASSFPDS